MFGGFFSIASLGGYGANEWRLDSPKLHRLCGSSQCAAIEKCSRRTKCQCRCGRGKAGLLPSLSGDLTQGVSYRPFQESGGNFVNGGIATSAADKVTQMVVMALMRNGLCGMAERTE